MAGKKCVQGEILPPQHFSNYVCDVTLSVYPHRASLKNMPGHGGNRTYDLCPPLSAALSCIMHLFNVSIFVHIAFSKTGVLRFSHLETGTVSQD